MNMKIHKILEQQSRFSLHHQTMQQNVLEGIFRKNNNKVIYYLLKDP